MKKYLVVFLLGSVFFLLIPLLAWGIFDLPQFFSHPARLVYACGILVLQATWAFFLPVSKKAKEPKKNPREMIDLILIQLLFFFIVFAAPFSDRHALMVMPEAVPLRYGGLVFAFAGCLFMLAAEKQLGDMFSVAVTLQKNHRLITTGVYRYIRHPRYLGILMFGLGLAFLFLSVLSAVAVLLLFFVLAWRVAAEDELMRQTFKEEWQAWRESTWRLIPFIF